AARDGPWLGGTPTRRRAASLLLSSERPLDVLVAGGGLDARAVRLRPIERSTGRTADDLDAAERLRGHKLHVRSGAVARCEVCICGQPPARHHRLVFSGKYRDIDVFGRRVDPWRLP